MFSIKIKKAVSLILIAATVICAAASMWSCSKKSEYKDYSYFVMDTVVTFRLSTEGKDGPLSDEYLDKVAEECAEILTKIDGLISMHNENSDVYALNSAISMMVGANEELVSLLKTAEWVSEITDGAFDYTLGALTELWNINGGGPKPSPSDITYARTHTGTDKFRINGTTIAKTDQIAKIDLGGIGKGYATQAILQHLSSTDVLCAVISVGGNIGVYGEKPDHTLYRVGLRDPLDESGVAGYLILESGFVSVSGDYERYIESDGVRYHHIIDSQTGYPASSGLHSVAVTSYNGAITDALSTALFVMGTEKAMELYKSRTVDFEAVFITVDGEILLTPGLADGLFEKASSGYRLEKLG